MARLSKKIGLGRDCGVYGWTNLHHSAMGTGFKECRHVPRIAVISELLSFRFQTLELPLLITGYDASEVLKRSQTSLLGIF